MAKLEIKSWADAEVAAQEYVELNSQLELLEEQFKLFAETRREQIGRERRLGGMAGIAIGFEKVAAQVKVPAEALPWLEKEYRQLVEQKPVARKPGLKKFLRAAASAVVELFRQHAVVYTSGYERFFLRLVNARRDGEQGSATDN